MSGGGVYFFHIPKTAGMPVWRFVEQSFPAEKVCPHRLWERLIAVPRPALAQWDVFRGHFLSHLEPFLGRRLRTFTMLRDPVERTVSHYRHVRRAREHPFHAKASNMSLAEFCLDPSTRHMVENYQASYLAKAPRDPERIARTLTPEQLARFELQETLQYPDAFDSAAELFERARERLAGFAVIGFAEDFSPSLDRFSQALHCAAPRPFEPENVNRERLPTGQAGPATLDLIRRLTEVDLSLYRFAKSLA